MITITGVGPSLTTFPRRPANDSHSSSGRITALALGCGWNAHVRRKLGGGVAVQRCRTDVVAADVATADVDGAGRDSGGIVCPAYLRSGGVPRGCESVLVSALDSQYSERERWDLPDH